MLLHTFGWAIVIDIDTETKQITDVYPARVKFRGFTEDINAQGYIGVTKYIRDNADELFNEANS